MLGGARSREGLGGWRGGSGERQDDVMDERRRWGGGISRVTEMKGCTAVSSVPTLTPSITHPSEYAGGARASCAFQLCARVCVCA